MTPDEPSDEELVKQMLERREQRRGKPSAPASLSPALEARWSEGFLEGPEQQTMPPGTPAGVVVFEHDGMWLYRDGRSKLTAALPGRPRFVAAAPRMDASCQLAEIPIVVHFARVEPQPDVALTEQVQAIAAELASAPASPHPLGTGIVAAAIATHRSDVAITDVAVFAGQDLGLVIVEADPQAVDAITFNAVSAAIMDSVVVTPERHLPAALFPESPWLEPGLPLRLRSGLRGAARADLADQVLALAGRAPATAPIDERTLESVTRVIGGLELGALPPLRTFHDVRGLALLLATSETAVRKVTYDYGTPDAPEARFGRIVLTFDGVAGTVELVQEQANAVRAWQAVLPPATWQNLIATMQRYDFPKPPVIVEPPRPGSLGKTISWDRGGRIESVAILGRTPDYSDVNRIVWSVVAQLVPDMLSDNPRDWEFPNTLVEAPREVVVSAPRE